MIKVIVKKPGKSPYEAFIKNELKEYQAIVGGYIEVVPYNNFLLVCNEEGKLLSLTPNFFFGNDLICGTVFFVAEDGENFASLDDKQIKYLMDKFVSRPARKKGSKER